jgi:hypothetical protein
MKKSEVALLASYEIALHETGPFSTQVQKLGSELHRRGLENQLEDIWVQYMADRECVLDIGCEFDR